MTPWLMVIILGYLIGSFPTAILVGRLVMRDDIRNHGSKNAGATNVFRVLGWKPALAVLLIDIGKGFLAVWLAGLFSVHVQADPIWVKLASGIAAILGHVWTVFAGFRGGKGVGTAFGVLIALTPLAAAVAFVVWLAVVLSTRYVSVASITAALVYPVFITLQHRLSDRIVPMPLVIMAWIIGSLIVITHRANILRLIRGEENRFGSKPSRRES
jgi:acyl phosphate:glycerol-3-phosphate acyltransferase